MTNLRASTSVLAALCLSASFALIPMVQAEEPAKKEDKENLLKNGDFEKGVTYWRGDRKVIEEEGKPENHIAEVASTKRQARSFSQDVDTRGMKDVLLKFRMKPSADYKGRGVQLRFLRRSSGFIYRDVSVNEGSGWTETSWDFGEVNGENKLTLVVEVKDGESGSVFFDDFVLVEVK